MCIALPAEIISIDGNNATVTALGVERIVNLQLIQSPSIGDCILIHAGCGIEKIDKSYFSFLENTFKEILERGELDEGSNSN